MLSLRSNTARRRAQLSSAVALSAAQMLLCNSRPAGATATPNVTYHNGINNSGAHQFYMEWVGGDFTSGDTMYAWITYGSTSNSFTQMADSAAATDGAHTWADSRFQDLYTEYFIYVRVDGSGGLSDPSELEYFGAF